MVRFYDFSGEYTIRIRGDYSFSFRNEHGTFSNTGGPMDFSQVDGILHIHLDNFFILGIACLCYFLGRWIKSEIKLLQDLSIPVPFIGGLPAAIIFACLKIS
ncbi:sodium/glutamate symporter, partial [Parasutterella sp.]